jgi:hypothetical protein
MSKRAPFRAQDLGLTRVRENGLLFETGTPVSFHYVHNDEKAPHLGVRFGQNVEPSGFYIQHVPDTDASLPRGWSSGTAVLEHPLVLVESFDPDAIYGPTGWKARLHAATKKGRRELSRYLMSLGFDSVVPVRGDATTEIVILRV